MGGQQQRHQQYHQQYHQPELQVAAQCASVCVSRRCLYYLQTRCLQRDRHAFVKAQSMEI